MVNPPVPKPSLHEPCVEAADTHVPPSPHPPTHLALPAVPGDPAPDPDPCMPHLPSRPPASCTRARTAYTTPAVATSARSSSCSRCVCAAYILSVRKYASSIVFMYYGVDLRHRSLPGSKTFCACRPCFRASTQARCRTSPCWSFCSGRASWAWRLPLLLLQPLPPCYSLALERVCRWPAGRPLMPRCCKRGRGTGRAGGGAGCVWGKWVRVGGGGGGGQVGAVAG